MIVFYPAYRIPTTSHALSEACAVTLSSMRALVMVTLRFGHGEGQILGVGTGR